MGLMSINGTKQQVCEIKILLEYQKLIFFLFQLVRNQLKFIIINNIRTSIKHLKLQIIKMAFRKSLKYAKISLRRREKLVNLTVLSNMSISKAARMLGLKPSTAKLIVKRYKQDGTFFESRSSKAKRLETSEVPQGLQFRADNIESHRNNEVSQVNQNEPILPSAVGCWESPQIPILMWSPEYQTYYWICLGGSFIGCQ